MEIDKESIKNFENQIHLLENLKKSVEGAIDRANQRLKRIKDGEPIEKVFESDRRPYRRP
jgi:hypothetical protein